MYLYPHDHHLLGICIIIPAIVEFLRVFIAYLINLPPGNIKHLERERLTLQAEVASIKSVQLELVRHSKLTRKIIKIEKDLEELKNNQTPKADKSKKILRILRIVLYVAAAVYLGTPTPVSISPSVIWPFSWITSEQTVGLQPWFLILTGGFALRHIYRTLVPIFFKPSACP